MNLYTFQPQGRPPERFTSAKANVILGGITYQSTTIHRSSYRLDTIDRKNNISITLPGDDGFAREYLEQKVGTLTVLVADLQGLVFFRGILVTASYNTTKNVIMLTFEPQVRLDTHESGQRRTYQRNCPYVLYDEGTCQATALYHTMTITDTQPLGGTGLDTYVRVSYDTGNRLNSQRDTPYDVLPSNVSMTANEPITKLIGGVFLDQHGNSYWTVNIDDQQLADEFIFFTVTLSRQHTLTPSDSRASMSFGCQRTITDCRDLHNNLDNYGGMPSMVRESPFSGGLSG